MQQNHSGNGDNVGGDKNEQTSNDLSQSDFGGGFAGRDYHGNVHNTSYHTQNFYYNEPQEKRDKNQLDLIQYSKREATRLLSQFLRNQVYITLKKKVDETKVIPTMQLKRVNQSIELLPSGTSIIDVYDRGEDIQGRLLILGDPGSGKSTALYKLAETLAVRAANDVNHPFPLWFNLSSWTDNYTTIKDWLIDELKDQHGVSNKLAQEYLEKGLIIPLLDGLDELRSNRQAACVEAINDFLLPRNWKNPLIVCSRLKDFELLNTRIRLNGSVILQPLSKSQINDYLQNFEAKIVQELIEKDKNWRELAQIPLFLNIMVLANEKLAREGEKQLNTQEKKISYLMEIYLEERLEDVGAWQSIYQYKISNSPERRQKILKSYLQYLDKPQQTRHYLHWLARQLDHNNQTIFLIEKLQPTDLASRGQRRIYRLIYNLIDAPFWWLILFWALFSRSGDLVNSIMWTSLTILLSLFVINISDFDKVKPVEKIKINPISIIKSTSLTILIVNLTLVIYWLIYKLRTIYPFIDQLFVLDYYPTRAWFYMQICGLIFGFAAGITSRELEIKIKPNQGIRSSIYNTMLTTGLLIILVGGLYLGLWMISGWLNQINEGLFVVSWTAWNLITMVFAYLIFSKSSQAVLQHFSLRLVLTFKGYTPWNYARFLDYCTEQSLLQRVGGGYRFIHRLLQEHLLNSD
ncbi:MAG: NACHT domain-containing NTPase [Crocosphaera sp.]